MDEAKFKLLVSFDILESEAFTEGIFDISFYHSINQKIQSAAIKNVFVLGIKCYLNQVMNDIWTNASVKTSRIQIGVKMESLVYLSATEVEISGSE